jgi:GT2 family glycosyltransferase
VIPAFDAAGFLRRTLPVAASLAGLAELIVVDAGSTDDTAAVAAAHGARVVRLAHRAGPAEARNAGAHETAAEVLLFLDADCLPHPDVARRVQKAFACEPALIALTGSYDDAPPEPGFFSQYMNLRHHYFHQNAHREGPTFWAGCGAVRRMSFLAAGGFDAVRYPRPQIEDVEFGLRLQPLGRMRLDPWLRVQHLKRWTLRSVVETDIRSRAIPWSQLILERGGLPSDLNLAPRQRAAALAAPFALAALPAAVWALATARWIAVATAATVLAGSLALNAPMVTAFARLRGLRFAAGAFLFQQIHLVYSAATLVACAAARWWRGV